VTAESLCIMTPTETASTTHAVWSAIVPKVRRSRKNTVIKLMHDSAALLRNLLPFDVSLTQVRQRHLNNIHFCTTTILRYSAEFYFTTRL